jgi:hypothetical protein
MGDGLALAAGAVVGDGLADADGIAVAGVRVGAVSARGAAPGTVTTPVGFAAGTQPSGQMTPVPATGGAAGFLDAVFPVRRLLRVDCVWITGTWTHSAKA